MFRTKPKITPPVATKNPKHNNVLVNVIAIVMTCNQTLEQQVFRK
jgi:hypothetical protein